MYNFKKNVKVYLVELNSLGAATNQHSLEIYSDITASQTFDEQAYKRKTLHALTDLHEHAVINNANPANFSFTAPLLDISTTPILLSIGSTYNTGTIANFDLYIESDNVIYQIKKAVIDSITFNMQIDAVLTMSVSGSASKLSKFGNVGAVTVPGTPVSIGTKNYARIDRMLASVGGSTLDSIAAINIDLKNDIQWTPNNTIQEAVSNTIMYPASYVLQGRALSGSITQFLTSENVDTISDTSTSAAIILSIFSTAYSLSTPILQFNLPSTAFTRRLNFEELINRVYDFRLNTNTTTVKPIYKGV